MSIFLGISFGLGGGGLGCGLGTLCGIAVTLVHLINRVLVPVIFAVSFLAFLWGIARAYIISRGNEEELKKGHALIFWGIIGFVVMLSLWGLVNIVANSFGLQGFGAPPLPTSY